MKGSLAKAARVFDALRIKMEAGAPAAPVVVEEAAPIVDAVAETPTAEDVVAEAVVDAVAETPTADAVTDQPAVTEEVLTPVEEKE